MRKWRRAYEGGHAREKARRQHVGARTLDEILDEMAGPQAMDGYANERACQYRVMWWWWWGWRVARRRGCNEVGS